ncbi:hypothetical protein, partial [Rossellomorea marisflavi]|uniref:hypothetical protein n=1 Tax=Rossellomorea marisflavi TaxID=189381 RepID=UPI00345750F4
MRKHIEREAGRMAASLFLLCLAPFPLFVPGTFSPFCAWHLFPFLCLAPFPLFVPGTFSPFCAWHLFPFL